MGTMTMLQFTKIAIVSALAMQCVLAKPKGEWITYRVTPVFLTKFRNGEVKFFYGNNTKIPVQPIGIEPTVLFKLFSFGDNFTARTVDRYRLGPNGEKLLNYELIEENKARLG